MGQGGQTMERRIEALASAALRLTPANAAGGADAAALDGELGRLEAWIEGASEKGLRAARAARRSLARADEAAIADVVAATLALQELFVEGKDPNGVVVPGDGDEEPDAPLVAVDDDGGFFEIGGGATDAIDHQLLPTFVLEAREHLDQADLLLLQLESEPSNQEHLNAIFRSMHSLKGSGAMVGLTSVKTLAHEAEQVLDAARRGEIALGDAVTDIFFDVLDELRRLVTLASELGPEATSLDAAAPPALFAQLRRIIDPETAEAPSPEPSAVTPLRSMLPKAVEAVAPKVAARDNVKVDAERLDRLIDTIGELVIAESMVCHSPALRSSPVFPRIARQVQQLDKISRSLQEMATSLRMVALRDTFERMRRVVRDVAKRCGKEVTLTLVGETTELDKAVVDILADPLMHLVRNAVDHGIELPADRIAAGKEQSGRLELAARHVGDEVHIEIRDDGRGLDAERIVAKAIERGLVGQGESLTEEQIADLIFAPGFSTAAVVTDISGRGVGMDVVRQAIESLRGSVRVRSTKGKGATFEIRLPLTLAVIDGMLVSVGGRRYIVPTLSVVCTVQRRPEQVTHLLEGGRAIELNGRWVPVYSLAQTLALEGGAADDGGRGLIMVVEHGDDRVGFTVEQLLGQQHIVIKSLGSTLDVRGIAGGAILPDGTVGLVLELEGLLSLAREGSQERTNQGQQAA